MRSRQNNNARTTVYSEAGPANNFIRVARALLSISQHTAPNKELAFQEIKITVLCTKVKCYIKSSNENFTIRQLNPSVEFSAVMQRFLCNHVTALSFL